MEILFLCKFFRRQNGEKIMEIVTLDYGSGGKKTSALIEELILPVLKNDALSQLGDGAVLSGGEKLVFSTDSFVVDPYFFPGGDIGKLSVCGTVNDVSMSGGVPKYLSLSFIIEEGLPWAHLERIVRSIGETAEKVGVSIVTGDTKVVEKGKGDGIFINTAGIGFLKMSGLSPENIKPDDVVLVSGTVGDHGTAVMLARNANLVQSPVASDCAPLNEIACALMDALGSDLKVMRDPTRGGVATTLNEFVEGTSLSIELEESRIPVSPSVNSACEILGLDPLYCANEGKLLAVVSPEKAETALETMRRFEVGKNAAIIGRVSEKYAGKVTIKTNFGGTRIAAKLAGAQLPRIC